MDNKIEVSSEELVKTLIAIREKAGLTPEDLGLRIGYQGAGARDNIKRIEEGTRNLGVNTLQQIAEALGWEITYTFIKKY